MKKLIVFVILCLIPIILISGCTSVLDPCEGKFQDCNHDCGEGILSSICKEKCTYDLNQCKESQ